jgi:hypothetical protein
MPLRLGQEIQEVLRLQLILDPRMALLEYAEETRPLSVAKPAPDIPIDCGGKCGADPDAIICHPY